MKLRIPRVSDALWHKLFSRMCIDLDRSELGNLLVPTRHMPLLTRRRATIMVHRVRMFAFLFAVLTPLWSAIDYAVFPASLWISLGLMRLVTSAAFAALLIYYKPSGSLFDAYRAIAILFAIPTAFYVSSHTLLESYELSGLSAAIGAGYAFLPFVLLAGLSIFPMTLVENLLIVSPILLAQALAGYLSWSTLNWPSFAGSFWLLVLITGVSVLAGMSQLAFMTAFVRQSVRDPLSGAFSRGSGEELLELQLALAQRSGSPLTVAFIDLDHFKSINDTYGHEAGDLVLAEMAARAVARLRRADVLVRWGGEEFVVILPDTDMAAAQVALGRLAGGGFGCRPDGAPVTASIGLAERIADGIDDWKALIEKADQRMYYAKRNGRDQICSGARAKNFREQASRCSPEAA